MVHGEEWLEVFKLLSCLDIRPSSGSELDGNGICLGVTNTPAPNPHGIISRVTLQDVSLTCRLLNAICLLPGWPRNFPMTSLQINTGRTSVHVDKPNIGLSCTFSIGSFSGGELWLDGEVIDTFANPMIFDGKIQHATMPFKGHRIAVVAFTHGLAYQLSDAEFSCLGQMGFSPLQKEEIKWLDEFMIAGDVPADI